MFMAVTHHGYNIVKMLGTYDIITVACDEKEAVCYLKRAYHVAAVEDPDNEGVVYPPEVVPKKKKQLLRLRPREDGAAGGPAPGPTPTNGAPSPLA